MRCRRPISLVAKKIRSEESKPDSRDILTAECKTSCTFFEKIMQFRVSNAVIIPAGKISTNTDRSGFIQSHLIYLIHLSLSLRLSSLGLSIPGSLISGSLHLWVSPSLSLSISPLFVSLSVRLSVCLSVCLSVFLFVYPSIFLQLSKKWNDQVWQRGHMVPGEEWPSICI